MQSNSYTGNTILVVTIYSLLFFLAFDFIFSHTVFKSQMLMYFMMIFNLLTFVFCAFKYGCESNLCAKLWVLYICLHIFSLGLNANTYTIPYWIISLLILFMPTQIVKVFNPNVFIYIGLFFAIGVFFQYLFPALYSSYVFPLFINTASEFIESSIVNEIGFSGFSPQTGNTAYLLLVCQSVLLAFKNYEGFLKNKMYRNFILFLFMFAIFLTGKRMLSFISIIIFLTSFYFSISKKNSFRNTILLIILFIGAGIAYQYFVQNIHQFTDNVYLRRFAISYISSTDGSDITSGRSELYQKAWTLFEQEPIIGIGANNFPKMSHMGTSVHNTYLQVLCEEGVLRFPLFIVPLLIIFFKTMKEVLKKNITNSLSFLLLSLFLQELFILYSFTGNTFVNINNIILYFMGVSFFVYALRYR